MQKLVVIYLLYSLLTADVSLFDTKDKKRKELIEYAESLLNSPYRYGGRSPKGFDCSGFTFYIFKEVLKKEIPRSSSQQAKMGKPVKLKQCQPGDLIFFANNGNRIDHVGIIQKRSKGKIWMIHASSSQGLISEEILSSSYWRPRIMGIRSVI